MTEAEFQTYFATLPRERAWQLVREFERRLREQDEADARDLQEQLAAIHARMGLAQEVVVWQRGLAPSSEHVPQPVVAEVPEDNRMFAGTDFAAGISGDPEPPATMSEFRDGLAELRARSAEKRRRRG